MISLQYYSDNMLLRRTHLLIPTLFAPSPAFLISSSSYQEKLASTIGLAEYAGILSKNHGSVRPADIALTQDHLAWLLTREDNSINNRYAMEISGSIGSLDIKNQSPSIIFQLIRISLLFKIQSIGGVTNYEAYCKLMKTLAANMQGFECPPQLFGSFEQVLRSVSKFDYKDKRVISSLLSRFLHALQVSAYSPQIVQLQEWLQFLSSRSHLKGVNQPFLKHCLLMASHRAQEISDEGIVIAATLIPYLKVKNLSKQQQESFKPLLKMLVKRIHNLDVQTARTVYSSLKDTHSQLVDSFIKQTFDYVTTDLKKVEDISLSTQEVLDLLLLVSSRIQLDQYSQQTQYQVLGFIRELLVTDNLKRSKALNQVRELLMTRFFSKEHKRTINKLLIKQKIALPLSLVEQLSKNSCQVLYHLNQLTSSGIAQYPFETQLKIGLLLQPYLSQSQHMVQVNERIRLTLRSKLVSRVQLHFLIDSMQAKSQVDWKQVRKAYQSSFQEVQKDEKTFSSLSADQKSWYMLLLEATLEQQHMRQWINRNQSQIKDQDLMNLFSYHMKHLSSGLQPSKYVFFQVLLQRLDSIVSVEENFKLILGLLGQYAQFVASGQAKHKLRETVFALLEEILLQHNTKGSRDLLVSTLTQYLTKNRGSFNYSHEYRHLLSLIVSQFAAWKQNIKFKILVLEHAVRLNYLTRANFKTYGNPEHLAKLSADLPFLERQRLKYYLKPSHVLRVERSLSASSIKVMLGNKNCLRLLRGRKNEVLDVVDRSTLPDLVDYACYATNKGEIIDQIMSEVVIKLTQAPGLMGMNILTMLQNLISNGYHSLYTCRDLTKRMMATFTKDINSYSYQIHSSFVRLAIAQPLVETQSYFECLTLDYRQTNLQNYQELLSLVIAGKYELKQHDIQALPQIIKKEYQQGLNIIMLVQDQLPAQQFKDLLSQLELQVQSQPTAFKHLNQLQVKYLQSKYNAFPSIESQKLQPGWQFGSTSSQNFLLGELDGLFDKTITRLQLSQTVSIPRIGKYAFVTIDPKRGNAHNQHKLKRRMVAQLSGQPQMELIGLMGSSHEWHQAQYLRNKYPSLLSDMELQLIRLQLGKAVPQGPTEQGMIDEAGW